MKHKRCQRCGAIVDDIQDSDERREAQAQANALGMDSLTEKQQLLVEGIICLGCFYEV